MQQLSGSTSMSSVSSSMPREVGNYRLERMLGRGGSSEVWLGRHKHLQERTAAVKVLLSHDGEAIQRFQREASLTSKLRHPGIVQIYDHGQYAPFYCTVMEYLPGGSLRQLLDRQSKLPLALALSIFRQVAAALDYAHSQQVIHRDVSPGNVLLDLPNEAQPERAPRALLTDFGIAREAGQNLTMVRAIMGTPAFFSPEHIKGATFVTPQSDIFSLGVVLYAMLSGHSPWAELPADVGFRFEAPLPLSRQGVELPGDVDRILQTLLAVDPAHRYLTAQAAVDALERVFVRHTSPTVALKPGSTPAAASNTATTPMAAASAAEPVLVLEASGLEPHAVEQVLGPRLQRAPMQQAEDRAEALRSPAAVADLLDVWSREGALRQRALGSLSTVRKISSRNIYFYQLRVLYETRQQPHLIEEADLKAAQLPLEPERDQWQTPLPIPQGFSDEAGAEVAVAGSARVVTCPSCQNGVNLCPTCKGSGRVPARKPASPEQPPGQQPGASQAAAAPIPGRRPQPTANDYDPCATCEGRGKLRCERCQGAGRLLQRRAFRWHRSANALHSHDEFDDVDLRWFQKACQPVDLYQEQMVNGFHADWRQVPGLAALLTQAEQRIDAETRVVLSEATISFVPATDTVFALASDPPVAADDDERLYRLTIYGFENAVPPDWRFLNRDRALLLFGGGFCLLLALVALFLLFFLRH